ncbi:hypothetical protein CK203_089411 [Vitis vinifera]|uniref:Uncharacterized protein n=1 Tax=Vitis vinifera TaxID=29760 RepID=A0A438E8S0_VITVI|nr:hypothetical protein CK203_089411 [Vitis vinifera]
MESVGGHSAPPMVTPPVPSQTEHGKLPTKTIPPTPASPTSAPLVPMLEATFVAFPMTSTIPPVAPTTSEPSITISLSEFHGLIHTFQTLTTTHAALFQQMAEMQPLAPTEETIPTEDTTTIEVQIPPPQEATIYAIASYEPQTVDTVTTTPEDASSPPEAPT